MSGAALFDSDGGFANQRTAFSYAENDFEGIVLQALRSRAMKLIHANEGNPRGLARVELYDLVRDPGERLNLSGEAGYADAGQGLAARIAQYQGVIAQNAAEPMLADEVDEQTLRELEAIGYN